MFHSAINIRLDDEDFQFYNVQCCPRLQPRLTTTKVSCPETSRYKTVLEHIVAARNWRYIIWFISYSVQHNYRVQQSAVQETQKLVKLVLML